MKRARSEARIRDDIPILDKIKKIKADDPLWGYRRV